MIVRSSNGSYEFIDFRETAPAAAFQDMYKNNTNASIFGGLARYVYRDGKLLIRLTAIAEFQERFGDWLTSTIITADSHGSKLRREPSRPRDMAGLSPKTLSDT